MTKGAAQAHILYLEVDSERSAMHSEGPPGQFHMQPPALRYLCVRRVPSSSRLILGAQGLHCNLQHMS